MNCISLLWIIGKPKKSDEYFAHKYQMGDFEASVAHKGSSFLVANCR